jgi:hypothetical protein
VELAGLAFSLRDRSSGDTGFFTPPTAGMGTSADGEDRLGDNAAARSLGN